MNSIISSFSLGKDISYDVLSWNLHGTETMSRPQSEARAGALTWDPFRATNRLQITNNPPFNVDKVKSESCESAGRLPFGLPGVNKSKEVGNAKDIVNHFTEKVKPMYEGRLILRRQIAMLAEARDRLLPKLMSGEIEV